MCLEKNAKALKPLTGGYLIKKPKGLHISKACRAG